MKVTINGKSEEVSAGSMLELLKSKSLEPQMVAVELNSRILERDELGSTPIKDGDTIELLFYMGGGF